jgi:hypothetical protein
MYLILTLDPALEAAPEPALEPAPELELNLLLMQVLLVTKLVQVPWHSPLLSSLSLQLLLSWLCSPNDAFLWICNICLCIFLKIFIRNFVGFVNFLLIAVPFLFLTSLLSDSGYGSD